MLQLLIEHEGHAGNLSAFNAALLRLNGYLFLKDWWWLVVHIAKYFWWQFYYINTFLVTKIRSWEKRKKSRLAELRGRINFAQPLLICSEFWKVESNWWKLSVSWIVRKWMYSYPRTDRNPQSNFTFFSLREKLNHCHSFFAVSCFLILKNIWKSNMGKL